MIVGVGGGRAGGAISSWGGDGGGRINAYGALLGASRSMCETANCGTAGYMTGLCLCDLVFGTGVWMRIEAAGTGSGSRNKMM